MRIFVFFIILSLFSPLVGVTPSQKAMIQDLEAAKKILSIKYAPLEWKKESLNLNLEETFQKAKERILTENLKTDRDFQKIFKHFLKSTQDYHVNAFFYSSSSSFCPLKVRGVNGRYFITSLSNSIEMSGPEFLFASDDNEENLLDEKVFELAIGDEIIALDDVPIKAVIESIIDGDLCGDRSPTGYALAERILFLRRGKYSENVPTGTFKLTVKKEGDESPLTCTLPWMHTREWVEDLAVNAIFDRIPVAQVGQKRKIKKEPPVNFDDIVSKFVAKNFTVRMAQDLLEDEDNQDEEIDFRKKGFLPPIGKILWESDPDKFVYTYLALNQYGERVGYIYLSTFDYQGTFADLIIEELIEAITYFNKESDLLVIDITNNPGGNLCFLYGVLSLLTNEPLSVPTHRETLNQDDVYQAALMYNMPEFLLTDLEEPPVEERTKDGYQMTKLFYQQLKNYAQFILDTWKKGQRMTEPYFLLGIDKILPHTRVQYTKPLIILTNELCFSCGDMFPAILQDNKRALIFGTRTAGAGGYVVEIPFTSQFGIKSMDVTKSIAYRLNGQPIENRGIAPDVICELTVRDLQENYVDYLHHLNLTVDSSLQ